MAKRKTVAALPLMENEHVKELLGVMKENSLNTKDLLEVFGYVGKLEGQLVTMSGELSAIRQELADIRDAQEHPAKHALENTAQTMEKTISGMSARLEEVKTNIIEGCKNAVAAFKEKGISALSNLASFFHIKDGLQSMKEGLEGNIRTSDKAIARIESISDTFHEAGRRVQNMGRALADKELLEDAKPSGKLANLLEAPFRREKESYKNALQDVNKAISGLERLEAAAEKVKDSRSEKKPSVRAQIKEHQEKAGQEKRDAPAAQKTKAKEAAL